MAVLIIRRADTVSCLMLPVFLIHAPAHNIVTGAGHCQVAGTIYIERAVSGEEILGAVVDYEEVISGDHDIKGIAGGLCGTLPW